MVDRLLLAHPQRHHRRRRRSRSAYELSAFATSCGKNAQYGSAIVHLRSTRMLYGEFSLWVSLILPFGPNQHGQGCRMRHLIRARVQRHYFQFGRPNNDTAESCGCICGRKRNATPLDASEQRAAWCLMGFLIRSA